MRWRGWGECLGMGVGVVEVAVGVGRGEVGGELEDGSNVMALGWGLGWSGHAVCIDD